MVPGKAALEEQGAGRSKERRCHPPLTAGGGWGRGQEGRREGHTAGSRAVALKSQAELHLAPVPPRSTNPACPAQRHTEAHARTHTHKHTHTHSFIHTHIHNTFLLSPRKGPQKP